MLALDKRSPLLRGDILIVPVLERKLSACKRMNGLSDINLPRGGFRPQNWPTQSPHQAHSWTIVSKGKSHNKTTIRLQTYLGVVRARLAGEGDGISSSMGSSSILSCIFSSSSSSSSSTMEADLATFFLGARLAGVLVTAARLRGVAGSEPAPWIPEASRFLRSFWTCWLQSDRG
jgi:hypothetical protein